MPKNIYLELVRKFPLRPIKNDETLDCAIKVIESLVDRDKLSSDEDDYLDVLGDLVKKYETDKHPITPVSDTEMLRYLIDVKGVTQKNVAVGTGIADSTISAILLGKRVMTRRHIELFARYFNIEPGVFI